MKTFWLAVFCAAFIAIPSFADVHVVYAQSAQFFTKHHAQPGDRFRVRLASSIVSANAKIIAEPLV